MLDDALEVIGDMGVANIRLVPGSLDLWLEGGPEMPDVSYDPRVSASARGALREELAYFCDCVLDDRQPQVIRAEEAMAAVEVALALVASARSDKEVEMAGTGSHNG
jgi:predicted dehydrogenase